VVQFQPLTRGAQAPSPVKSYAAGAAALQHPLKIGRLCHYRILTLVDRIGFHFLGSEVLKENLLIRSWAWSLSTGPNSMVVAENLFQTF
jgi:hypothetical protein